MAASPQMIQPERLSREVGKRFDAGASILGGSDIPNTSI
jgi:hypothetical protein